MFVRLSIEGTQRKRKPSKGELAGMTDIFGKYDRTMDTRLVADRVGNHGSTFSPTVFSDLKRCEDNFLQMQLFSLDFDGGISFEEVKRRADHYHIPILFAYRTFRHGPEIEKFRIVLVHEVVITDKEVARTIILLLMKIFPESDPRCKNVAHFYCGGKELFYYDENEPTFNIADLARSYYCYEYEKESSNYTKRIETFAKSRGIATTNHCLVIERVCNVGIDDFDANAKDYIYIVGADKPSFRIKKRYQDNTRERESVNRDFEKSVRISGDKKIEDICPLFRDFIEGNELEHNLRFKLATNLRKISSGQKIFFEHLPLHTEDIEGWKPQFLHILNSGYAPESCGGCPYYDTCDHDKNMFLTVTNRDNSIRKLVCDTEYQDVTETYNAICRYLDDAVQQKKDGIYLISAQTAIGKTTAYTKYFIDNKHLRVIIALPTNMLKGEVFEKLKKLDDVYVTPSLTNEELGLPQEIIEEIEDGYRRGLKGVANTILRKYMKEFQKLGTIYGDNKVKACMEYLSIRERLAEYPRVIITTHARLFTMSEDFLSHYTVIVDEDGLLSSFQGIEHVSMETLQDHFFNNTIPVPVSRRLSEIFQSPADQYGLFSGDTQDHVDTSDVVFENLMQATSYYVDSNRRYVHYYMPKYLPKGKYIVMSATLSAKLFQMFYPDRYIYEYPKLKSKYMGKLIQYTSHSLSRRDCDNIFDSVLKKSVELTGAENIITFKSYTEEYRSKGIIFNKPNLYYGKVAGSDELRGKDIIIIGTPHNTEIVYKLIGKHMGLDVDDDLCRRRIEYNGYSFNFATYKNEELREIQLHFIRSELEQAVGRARLLREPCTVYLFSNFPCDQAELIQEEYLEKQ